MFARNGARHHVRPLAPDWRPMVETALGVLVGGLGLMVVWGAVMLAERRLGL